VVRRQSVEKDEAHRRRRVSIVVGRLLASTLKEEGIQQQQTSLCREQTLSLPVYVEK
jgi:hypothetical protein